jgi:glycosyltransferase involved in cell wall biosynthesis
VADADYLVQLSKSEALSYSLTEALCAKTKVITTDLPSICEVNIEDKVNGIIIPLEYFEEENKSLLKDKILEAYKNKNLKFDYTYDKKKFNQYKEIFSK